MKIDSLLNSAQEFSIHTENNYKNLSQSQDIFNQYWTYFHLNTLFSAEYSSFKLSSFSTNVIIFMETIKGCYFNLKVQPSKCLCCLIILLIAYIRFVQAGKLCYLYIYQTQLELKNKCIMIKAKGEIYIQLLTVGIFILFVYYLFFGYISFKKSHHMSGCETTVFYLLVELHLGGEDHPSSKHVMMSVLPGRLQPMSQTICTVSPSKCVCPEDAE